MKFTRIDLLESKAERRIPGLRHLDGNFFVCFVCLFLLNELMHTVIVSQEISEKGEYSGGGGRGTGG